MNFVKQIVIVIPAAFFSLATVNDILHQSSQTDEGHLLEGSLTREEQILQCASCHQQAYENELIGPHAASYKKLMEHIDHVDTSSNFTGEWKAAVKTKTQICLACHAGSNLYETVFSELASETDESKYTLANHPKLFNPPPPRKEETSMITGIDCLTCHVKDNKVLTSANYTPTGITMEGQCDVMPSKFFSNDLNCVSCHKFTYVETMENMEKGRVTVQETNCLKCHQEYDKSGKGTHYYYWKHDPADKKRPHHMELFSCLGIALKTNEGANFISFNWQNRNAPHGYPDCAEYIFEIRYLTPNNDTILLATERINRKVDAGASLKAMFGGNEPPGTPGYCNYVQSDPFYREYPLDNLPLKDGKVLVTINVKTQYWGHDAEAKYLESRIFEL